MQTPARAQGKWLLLIATVFIACLLTANIIAVKAADFGFAVLPAAVIVFPVSYIVGDVLTEVYGYATARRVIWLGFLANVILVVFIYLGGLLPSASFWAENQAAYERVLGFTGRLLAASFVAYLFGEFTNSVILAVLKVRMRGRWLFVRTIGSTLVGQLVDSAIFITLAFSGVWPASQMGQVVLTQWLVKSAYEALATPLTYLVVGFLKRSEGVDVYDERTDFSPLAFR
ncbi:MAG: queuosine precursor transporter [Chloroflexi bacterium]|nr:queuosine precursor transporter [Chloroflexota bacterium]